MKTLCIVCPEDPAREAAARAHFAERGVSPWYFPGIHAETFGLFTTHAYLLNKPKSGGEIMPPCRVGCFLSHYAAWLACSLLNEPVLILESDAEFSADWDLQLSDALAATPYDVDLLFVGSCNCSDKPQTQISGPIWRVEWPMCTHAYIVWPSALPVLLRTQRDCRAPIDISLGLHAFPLLNVYTVLPRIVGQREMPDLMP